MTGLDNISNILAIRFARVGDVVLLLPALVHLKRAFSEARLTLVTGKPCAPVAKLCPYIDDVISVDRLQMRDGGRFAALGDMIDLVRELRARQFDLVIDFHSFRETNLLAWFSGATYRLGMKRADRAYLSFCFNLGPALEDKSLHVADMFQSVVTHIPGVSEKPAIDSPVLVPPQADPTTESRVGLGPVVALYVGASVPDRRWSASRFAMLASRMATEWGARVVILSGASQAEERIARQVENEAALSGQVQLLRGLSLPNLVRAIAGADVLVSNDSGPMHIGSALGVPTLGIFSSSLPEHYGPRGNKDRFIKRDSMADVQTEEVVAIVAEMWATERRGHRS